MMMRILITLLIVFALTSCGDSQSLGGSYFLKKDDLDHVYVLKKKKGEAMVAIDQQIVDWRRVANYVVVLRKVAISPDCYDESGRPTIITHYSSTDEFWIIDLYHDIEFGPLSDKDYATKLAQLNLPYTKLAVPGSYRENTQEFQKNMSKCRYIR